MAGPPTGVRRVRAGPEAPLATNFHSSYANPLYMFAFFFTCNGIVHMSFAYTTCTLPFDTYFWEVYCKL